MNIHMKSLLQQLFKVLFLHHNFTKMHIILWNIYPDEAREIIANFNRQVQKSDRINSDHQSGSDQLGSTRIDSDRKKIKNNKEMRLLPV